MRAVVFREIGRVEVADVPEPRIEEPDDAIVRVSLTAICGSDLHFLRGKAPIDPGGTLGHEAIGVVEEVGPEVARTRVGDRVVVAFDIACGACWFCRRGQTHLCESFRNLGAGTFGGDLGGAQAERLRVPHADVNLKAVPDEVEDERGLFVGDALTTGVYAAGLGGVSPGDTVAVVGAGPVGYFAVQAARAFGAGRVLGLDRVPARLELIERAGAEPIDVDARHPQAALDEITDGRGADVAIEAVGHPSAFRTAVDVVRRGGTVVVVGLYAGETEPIQLGVYWARALEVRFGGTTPIHAWWDRAMDEVLAGRIEPGPLISHRLPLEEAAEGYRLFEAREATKVVLRP